MRIPLPLIYIAGPFRGPTPLDVRRNVEQARDAGLRVAKCGGYPMIPHTMTAEFDKQLTDEFWLTGTMEMLRRCDGMYLLPTWEQSAGAKAERQFAIEQQLPIFYDVLDWRPHVPDLTDWIRSVHVLRQDGFLRST